MGQATDGAFIFPLRQQAIRSRHGVWQNRDSLRVGQSRLSLLRNFFQSLFYGQGKLLHDLIRLALDNAVAQSSQFPQDIY